ncbi:MAG: SDR family oxidoreductase [Halioglobus sp.]|nr:SDR family oxidoreductase [Halioglobus sp.]
MKTFANKIAIVTGGGSGIGRALVQQLALRGCHVALCDLNEADMQETLRCCQKAIDAGVRITTHRCDVANEDDLIAFQRAAALQHDSSHINLLFNNAGISGGQSFLLDDREQWDRVFAICWSGVYLGCRVFMPMLLASEQAHIINISSVNGFWACLGSGTEHTAYSAAKFAVKGFTEALTVDLRKHAPHIKASVVMPGHIGTSIARNSQAAWLGECDDMDAETIDHLRRRWTGDDPAAKTLTDDMVKAVVRKTGEDFRDKAPTSADQAAEIILDGIGKAQWRILVGDDAKRLDRAVRENPEQAYDQGFFDFLSSPVD